MGCFLTQTRLVGDLKYWPLGIWNKFTICSPSYMWNRKRTNKDTSEKISRSKLGRNRRSTGSGSVVLGWYRNVSVPHVLSYRCLLCLYFSWMFFLMAFSLFCSDSSYSLLADDVLGSFLLCSHPKKPKCSSLIIHFPSGLVTHLIENTRKGKFLLEVIVLSRQDQSYTLVLADDIIIFAEICSVNKMMKCRLKYRLNSCWKCLTYCYFPLVIHYLITLTLQWYCFLNSGYSNCNFKADSRCLYQRCLYLIFHKTISVGLHRENIMYVQHVHVFRQNPTKQH